MILLANGGMKSREDGLATRAVTYIIPLVI